MYLQNSQYKLKILEILTFWIHDICSFSVTTMSGTYVIKSTRFTTSQICNVLARVAAVCDAVQGVDFACIWLCWPLRRFCIVYVVQKLCDMYIHIWILFVLFCVCYVDKHQVGRYYTLIINDFNFICNIVKIKSCSLVSTSLNNGRPI